MQQLDPGDDGDGHAGPASLDCPWERTDRALHIVGSALALVSQAAAAVAAIQSLRHRGAGRCR
jgi:hypothetical protein